MARHPSGSAYAADRERIDVLHRGAQKMVGKRFYADGIGQIFLHEESGSQKHENTNCSSPLDFVLVSYLERLGVGEIHHQIKGMPGAIEWTTPAEVLRDGARLSYDGRDRLYLNDRLWKHKRVHYIIPFCTHTHVLQPAPGAWEPIKMPEPKPDPQGRLI